LRPAITIVDKKGKAVSLPTGEARYALSVDAILSVEDGSEIKAGDVLARIPTEGAKTRDITGGLPRVAELFEARKPKDCAVLAETDGYIEFGKDYKNKRRVVLRPKNEKQEPIEYLLPKAKHVSVREGDYVEKGDFIIEGHPSPHDILRIKGVEELAVYLINEIQEVYRLQGVKINDKHIEVIVRQMLQKMEIEDGGDTTLLPGEQVDLAELEEANKKALELNGKPAKGRPVLLGITKASLQTRSVFSAASFQETTRVLTDAAVNGKVDTLEGLKENVIVGRLIPAGTGGAVARIRRIAAERDKAIQAERAAAIPPALEAPAEAAAE
jgi:DNA-directed RNA polymerase subunit beta'